MYSSTKHIDNYTKSVEEYGGGKVISFNPPHSLYVTNTKEGQEQDQECEVDSETQNVRKSKKSSWNLLLQLLKQTERTRLENKFNELASKWEKETSGYSTAIHKSMHPTYLQIISLGKPVLPFILQKLKNQPNHWFVALKAIADYNPVPPEHMHSMKLMREDWLRWGEANNLI